VSKVLLSDEQINKVWPDDVFSVNDLYSDIIKHVGVVCKAQLRRAVEWLSDPCTEHGTHNEIRWDCPECWNELKGEVK
jgi:hypothetical protein